MSESAGEADQERLRRATAPVTDAVPAPRAMIVVAHPDDEVIALGARLRRYCDAVLLHVTDGAPLDGGDARAHGFASLADYRAARRRELEAACALAGIPSSQLRQLGIPDQRAAHALGNLADQVLQQLREFRPEVVVTHPYEGGHPDHDACAFAVHTAVRQMAATGEQTPLIVEAAFYHQGPQGGIETGVFLPGSGPAAVEHWLSPEERERKQALLASFPTQRETLQFFPVDVERFRIAPAYNFAERPHPGKLFYEYFLWGMTGDRFCSEARAAQERLLREAAPCR